MFYGVYLIILIVSTFAFSFLGVWLMYLAATKLLMMREPEARDNHSVPTPTGAGLGVMLTVMTFLAVASAPGTILLGILLLTTISFWDDFKGLPVMHRLAYQAIAVILALTSIHGAILGDLVPLWLERVFLFFLWMWIINLHNFMDGIDEISATHALCLCVGLIVFSWSAPDTPKLIANDAAVLASGMAAFYIWNRHPARIFLGDSGSIPLGLLVGYLLFNLAAAGYAQAALILPAYYLADASYTLLKRALAGKPVWQAHSEHAYQQSVRNGRNHHDTVMHMLLLNMLLIVLAVATTLHPLLGWVCVLVAYALAFTLMGYFARPIIERVPQASPSYLKAAPHAQTDLPA